MIFSENELQKHYRLLLGVETPWQVKDVKLELSEKRVEIELGWAKGAKAKCPVCGRDCTVYDYAPERTWRYLDTMQFETILRARVPRVDCATDGVKTIAVPWAEPGGRFTRLFERFAVEVLLCARIVKQAASFAVLRDSGLKVARAWAAKELFSKLWTYRYEGSARRFFKQWFGWVSRSRLKPLINVAGMLKSHLENILTYLRHPITNAVTEGLTRRCR